MIFLDKQSKRSKDENGYLVIKDNPIAVAGVFDYAHSELFEDGEDILVKVYKDFEDLKKVKDSFANKPIYWTHKWVGDETKQVDGAIGSDIRLDEDKKALIADLIIYNPDLVEVIEKGEVVELSPGFTGEVVEEKGRYDGQSYDYRQYTDVVNHLAVVERGRAKDNLKIQDSENPNLKKGINMAKDGLKAFADSLRKVLKIADEEAKKLDEGKTEDEETPETKIQDEDIFKEIDAIRSNADMSEEDKVKAIKSLVESYDKSKEEIEDEENIEKKQDEDVEKKTDEEMTTVEKDDKAEEIGSLIEQVIEKKLEKFTDTQNRQVARIQDAYDNVSSVLGTSFNKNGMSADDIYKFGYESLSGQTLAKGMDAKTAFGIVGGKFNKPSTTFKDSAVNEKSNISDYLSKHYK